MPLAPLVTLKSRREFLRIRGGARWGTPSLLLEARHREPPVEMPDDTTAGSGRGQIAAGPAQFGFTVTKKLGNAVVRNRIRRRLREIARQCATTQAAPGCDYVIVAREAALRRPALALSQDLETALREVNKRLLQPQRRLPAGRHQNGQQTPPPDGKPKQKTHRDKK